MLQNKVRFEGLGLQAVWKQDSQEDLLGSPERGPEAIYWGKWFVWTGFLFIFILYLLTSHPPSAQLKGSREACFSPAWTWARKEGPSERPHQAQPQRWDKAPQACWRKGEKWRGKKVGKAGESSYYEGLQESAAMQKPSCKKGAEGSDEWNSPSFVKYKYICQVQGWHWAHRFTMPW